MTKSKTSFSNLLWGPIESVDLAKMARLPSLWFTAFGAALWVIIAVFGLFTPSAYGHWAIIYAIALSLIAWGLLKMRKIAAVFALVVALVGLLSGGGVLKIVSDVVMLFVAVAAIRGTFAYSLLTQQQEVSEGV